MKTEISEEEWLEEVQKKKCGGNGVLLEVYYEVMHKAGEYRFFVKDGVPLFPKHKKEGELEQSDY